MEKPARTQFPIHELVAHRWSPRAFDERPERLRERELRSRSRRPIVESTFVGQWGNPIA
jgi:hypothetical protein